MDQDLVEECIFAQIIKIVGPTTLTERTDLIDIGLDSTNLVMLFVAIGERLHVDPYSSGEFEIPRTIGTLIADYRRAYKTL